MRVRVTLRRGVAFAALLTAALVGLAGISAASHSRYEQLSTGQINGNGAFGAILRGFSSDGNRVFFVTDEQLVSSDTDTAQDVYEHSAGTTRRVSAGPINSNGAFDAEFKRASADGKRVFFVTDEPLVPADTDAAADIYMRAGGTTTRISAGQINGNGPFGAQFRGASADGKRVFFETDEPLVAGDHDTSADVYERSAGTTTRVSVGQVHGNGPFDATFDGASSDGARVFFHTGEKLVSGDTDSFDDIYKRSAGTTSRVSAGQINGNGSFDATFDGATSDGSSVFMITNERLVPADTDTATDVYRRSAGTTTRVSVGQIHGNGPFDALFRDASADGKRVFFDSSEQLVPGDTDSSGDIYKRSAGVTSRISAGQINGNGAFGALFEGASSDGAQVFFETSEQLVPDDSDTAFDLYKRSGGITTRVSVGQINGNGAFSVFFGGASANGKRIFFGTSEQLVPGDGDAFPDVYERAGGQTSLISLGNAPGASSFAGTTTTGSAVFFQTQDRVLPSDFDDSSDVYGAYLAP